MDSSLYARLGGSKGIATIIEDVVANHLSNPVVAPRFRKVEDLGKLKRLASEFFCAGSGGAEGYSGRDMRTTHSGMNISEQEYLSVMDDIVQALDKNGIGAREKGEVIAILYSLKGDILRV